LLADEDSADITDFVILNTVAEEGICENADDPSVQADVAKYVSVWGANPMIVGTPYPGTFMINSQGVVTSRFFEEFYRERNTTTNVMLKLGVGLSPIAAVEGETAHLKFTAYPSNTSVTVGTRFSLALDVVPGPNMHVYAPGAEEKGYRVIGFNLDKPDIARIEPVEYPDSEIYYFEPLDEHVPVYQEPFTLLQEIVMDGEAETEEIMRNLDALTLTGTLEYQACDDAICFLPQSIPVSFTVDLEMPDRQRADR
ncbi:MAG: protein-disulfide reductase DsbD family protein, partial [Gammaproteobacteria bacterium]|nr:protein-disulfide reductase DsbD family protein [Gammaproteobacteria bacterium]